MDIVIAGTSFPCGVGELGEVALRNGFNPIYIDHPRNAASTDQELSPLRFEVRLPDDVAVRSGLFLPLLESWVSVGQELPTSSGLRFDRRAATISRSKLAISKALADASINHISRVKVDDIEQALRAASDYGYPVVLRVDGGYSGRGVFVAGSPEELRNNWQQQTLERGSADFEEMRCFLKVRNDSLVIEPWMPGAEWSVDCIVGPAGTHLVRVCEKETAIVAGRPVTLGYRLNNSHNLWAKMHPAVERWVRALFASDSVSFACFDICQNSKEEFLPLDFAVRLGSDSIPLLVRRAGLESNAYAAALDAALTRDERRMAAPRGGYAIVHAFARKSGRYVGVTTGSGEVINSREIGSAIEQRGAGPVFRKVASVFTYFDTEDDFSQACRTSSDWIDVELR